MATNTFPEIATARLLLRKLELSDWEVVSFLRTDKTVNKYVNRPAAETKEKALEFIERIHNNLELKNSWYWCISTMNNGPMVGSICLWNLSEDRKKAEIGYDLHPEYQGEGLMTEALQAIVQFAFETLHLDKIEAFTHLENESSRSLLEKNNFIILQHRTDEDNKNNVIYERVKKPAGS